MNPFSGANCAQREAAAAVGIVLQLQNIVGAGGSDDVLAFGIARLPLSLPDSPSSEATDSAHWRQLQYVI